VSGGDHTHFDELREISDRWADPVLDGWPVDVCDPRRAVATAEKPWQATQR